MSDDDKRLAELDEEIKRLLQDRLESDQHLGAICRERTRLRDKMDAESRGSPRSAAGGIG